MGNGGLFIVEGAGAVTQMCSVVSLVQEAGCSAVQDMLYINNDGTATRGINFVGNFTTMITIPACTLGINFSGVTPTCVSVAGVGSTASHVLDMVDGYLGMLVETGSYAATADSGITITATNSRPVSFLFDDSAALLDGSVEITPILGRMLFTLDQTTAQVRFAAIQGHIQANSGIDFSGDTSEYYAVQGILECAGITDIGTNTWAAGICGMIWADGNFTGSANDTYGLTAGVLAKLYQTSGATSTTAGVGIATWWNSADTWSYGLYIENGSVDAGNDIRLQGGAVIGSGTAAPTHSAVSGSFYLRTGQTDAKAILYVNTSSGTGTTWTILNTVIV